MPTQTEVFLGKICEESSLSSWSHPHGAVLNVVRRPEVLCRRVISLVEEGLEGVQDDLHIVSHGRVSSISLIIDDAGRELSPQSGETEKITFSGSGRSLTPPGRRAWATATGFRDSRKFEAMTRCVRLEPKKKPPPW